MVEFSPDIKFEFTFYQMTPLLMWMLMHWQLRAIAPMPALPAGYSVATMDCSLDGRADSGVFAIGQWVADSLVDVRHAWVALTEVERLDTVPLNRVSCSYDGDRPGLREGAAHEQASRCFGHGAHGDGIIGV